MFVAAWRGLGAYDLPATGHDPIAKHLLPIPSRWLLEAADANPVAATWAMKVAGLASFGLSHHLPFRTRAIDEALIDETRRGTRQVVLLGAGLDARAYRLDELAASDVYEVDFPSTQAYKRAATAGLRARARAVRYAAVDFRRDRLSDALVEAGFSVSAPAVFIWEGVTMYLDDRAIAATLDEVRGLAAVGSLLAVTYQTTTLDRLRRLAGLVFRAIGEPLDHRIAPAELAALLGAHDFTVESDEGDPEWAARYHHNPIRLPMTERLTLARMGSRSYPPTT